MTKSGRVRSGNRDSRPPAAVWQGVIPGGAAAAADDGADAAEAAAEAAGDHAFALQLLAAQADVASLALLHMAAEARLGLLLTPATAAQRDDLDDPDTWRQVAMADIAALAARRTDNSKRVRDAVASGVNMSDADQAAARKVVDELGGPNGKVNIHEATLRVAAFLANDYYKAPSDSILVVARSIVTGVTPAHALALEYVQDEDDSWGATAPPAPTGLSSLPLRPPGMKPMMPLPAALGATALPAQASSSASGSRQPILMATAKVLPRRRSHPRQSVPAATASPAPRDNARAKRSKRSKPEEDTRRKATLRSRSRSRRPFAAAAAPFRDDTPVTGPCDSARGRIASKQSANEPRRRSRGRGRSRSWRARRGGDRPSATRGNQGAPCPGNCGYICTWLPTRCCHACAAEKGHGKNCQRIACESVLGAKSVGLFGAADTGGLLPLPPPPSTPHPDGPHHGPSVLGQSPADVQLEVAASTAGTAPVDPSVTAQAGSVAPPVGGSAALATLPSGLGAPPAASGAPAFAAPSCAAQPSTAQPVVAAPPLSAAAAAAASPPATHPAFEQPGTAPPPAGGASFPPPSGTAASSEWMFRQRFMSMLSTKLRAEHTSLSGALSRLAASSSLRAALGNLAAPSAIVLRDFAPPSQGVVCLDEAPPPPGTFSDAAAAAERALWLILAGTDGAADAADAAQDDGARSVSSSVDGSYSPSGDEEMAEADFG